VSARPKQNNAVQSTSLQGTDRRLPAGRPMVYSARIRRRRAATRPLDHVPSSRVDVDESSSDEVGRPTRVTISKSGSSRRLVCAVARDVAQSVLGRPFGMSDFRTVGIPTSTRITTLRSELVRSDATQASVRCVGEDGQSRFECFIELVVLAQGQQDNHATASVERWCEAWNQRDLEVILEPMCHDVVFRSSRARAITGSTTVRGLVALEQYWSEALRRRPQLRFSPGSSYIGPRSTLLLYSDERGHRVGEMFRFDKFGGVTTGIATREVR
jgi:hypothetical protein